MRKTYTTIALVALVMVLVALYINNDLLFFIGVTISMGFTFYLIVSGQLDSKKVEKPEGTEIESLPWLEEGAKISPNEWTAARSICFKRFGNSPDDDYEKQWEGAGTSKTAGGWLNAIVEGKPEADDLIRETITFFRRYKHYLESLRK